MMKIQILLLIALLGFISSCSMSEPPEHKNFMSIVECYVYEYQVASETYLFGKVEFIKPNQFKSGKCINRLKGTYLLHLNKNVVAVYGEHPKNNIQLIMTEYRKHATDTTKLGEFSKTKDGYAVRVKRLCQDKNSIYNNRFVYWKRLKFQKENDQSKRISEQVLNYFYKWSENENSKVNSLNVISFLENPINLQEFKKKKNRQYVTTSVQNGKEYYFNPKNEDSIYYTYNVITENIRAKGVNKIMVFKHGKNKHSYEDPTETLIELKISNKDEALGAANLVGLSKTALETKFGKATLIYEDRSVYYHKNKVLVIEFKDAVITSFQYLNLNTTFSTDDATLLKIIG